MKVVNILFNQKRSSNDKKAFGVERCFIDYSKYLVGYGVEVLSVFKKGVNYLEEIKKVKSETLQVNATNSFDFTSIFCLALSFFKFCPEVAICHSGRALYFARVAKFLSRKKFPIIAINHGSNIKKFLKADYIMSVNSHFAEAIIKEGKSADRSLTIPNMIEVPSDFKKVDKVPFRNPVRLGFLGRISKEKTLSSVIKAMDILRKKGVDNEFYIGGIGNAEGDLRSLVKDLKLENEVKFMGWTSDKESFFKEVDIFVLPSLYETFGIVLLEAMLYSTPIITTNTWGPNEIIESEINGLKFSRDDIEKMPNLLAEAIEKMIKDEEFARKMAGKAYRDLFEKYTSDIVSKKLYDLCKRVSI